MPASQNPDFKPAKKRPSRHDSWRQFRPPKQAAHTWSVHVQDCNSRIQTPPQRQSAISINVCSSRSLRCRQWFLGRQKPAHQRRATHPDDKHLRFQARKDHCPHTIPGDNKGHRHRPLTHGGACPRLQHTHTDTARTQPIIGIDVA